MKPACAEVAYQHVEVPRGSKRASNVGAGSFVKKVVSVLIDHDVPS